MRTVKDGQHLGTRSEVGNLRVCSREMTAQKLSLPIHQERKMAHAEVPAHPLKRNHRREWVRGDLLKQGLTIIESEGVR